MAKDRSEIAPFLSSPHYCARPMRFESHVQQVVTDALTEKAWEDTVQGLSKKQTNKGIIS